MSTTRDRGSSAGRGFFVSLDGPDGAGKSTQSRLLASWLRERGECVVCCRDPGGTALGDRLRSLLLDRHDTPIGLRAEMLLYMASRAQLVEETIRPALQAGKMVVSDRYLLANIVYQGYAGGLDVEDLWRVGDVATGMIMPDLTLIIDVPVEVALQRVGESRDRMEDRPVAFREAVRRGFLQAAVDYPAPVVVIDGSSDPEETARRIQNEVARALGIHPRP